MQKSVIEGGSAMAAGATVLSVLIDRVERHLHQCGLLYPSMLTALVRKAGVAGRMVPQVSYSNRSISLTCWRVACSRIRTSQRRASEAITLAGMQHTRLFTQAPKLLLAAATPLQCREGKLHAILIPPNPSPGIVKCLRSFATASTPHNLYGLSLTCY